MERALGEEFYDALWTSAELLGVPLNEYPEWPHVPALRLFERMAVARKRDALLAQYPGMSGERALGTACSELGVNSDTGKSWFERPKMTARSTR